MKLCVGVVAGVGVDVGLSICVCLYVGKWVVGFIMNLVSIMICAVLLGKRKKNKLKANL